MMGGDSLGGLCPELFLRHFQLPIGRKILQVCHLCERASLASRGGLEHFQGNTYRWAFSVKNMPDDVFSTISFHQT